MGLFESEIAENGKEELDARRLSARIAVSLALAIAAYIGLLLGGNIILSPTASADNALTSSGKETQPLQLTAREAVRGVLAAERKVAPKQTLDHFGSASLPAPSHLSLADWAAPVVLPSLQAVLRPAVLLSNQPRAPPAA